MSKLDAYPERLKARQREIIIRAAEFDMLPPAGALWRIAELENAVEAVAGEGADQSRQAKD